MSEVVLKIDSIYKQYRLGQIGTGTLSHDLNRWWAKIRGKEDPFLKVGETNDRTTKGNSKYVWALEDINFEVNRGEVLGIIGKNGAGKSTLLKILSRVTSPTKGSIKTRGRIASLLEVGTGFHPEMTGRENIYLNGAILGMTKKEIASKIDEIITFSGCERYIDTPVKRYSSGMTVRLAFAVAAHLDPEILVVDEVLAVGDAEFQKKAIGKMQEIAKGGARTVLFVSHNMAAVRSLCTQAIVLENGKIKFNGSVDKALEVYETIDNQSINSIYIGEGFIKKATINNGIGQIKFGTFLKLEVDFETSNPIKNLVLGVVIKDLSDSQIVGINNKIYKEKLNENSIDKGKISVEIADLQLLPGMYKLDIFLGDSLNDIEVLTDAIYFTVVEDFQLDIINTLDFKINKIFHKNVSWKLNK